MAESGKRVEFFIDWGPHGSASRTNTDFEIILERNDRTKPEVGKIFRKYLPGTMSEFEFSFRSDGLFIFAVHVPMSTPQKTLEIVSGMISDRIKSEALGHIHHHHVRRGEVQPHPHGAMWFAARFRRRLSELWMSGSRGSLRQAHAPVRLNYPLELDNSGETIERIYKSYIEKTAKERVSIISDILLSDEKIVSLTSPYRQSNMKSIFLLDKEISEKHDEAIRLLELSEFLLQKRNYLYMIFSFSIVTVPIVIFVLYSLHFQIQFNYIYATSVFTLSTVLGVFFHNLVDMRVNGRMVTGVSSKIGYLRRSADFAILLSRIWDKHGDEDEYAPPNGYDAIVNSLCSLVEAVNISHSARRSRNSQALAASGLLLSIASSIFLDASR